MVTLLDYRLGGEVNVPHFWCSQHEGDQKEWSEKDEVAGLREFDISGGLWTWGHYGLKLFRYWAVGVSVICFLGGANKEIVSDSEVWSRARDRRE